MASLTAPAIQTAESGRVAIDLTDGNELPRLAKEAAISVEQVA